MKSLGLIVILSACGCTAIDDFGSFHPVPDLSTMDGSIFDATNQEMAIDLSHLASDLSQMDGKPDLGHPVSDFSTIDAALDMSPPVSDLATMDASLLDAAGPQNPPDMTMPPNYGAPCNGVCAGGLMCFMHTGQADFPNGFCSSSCVQGQGQCPAGTTCEIVEKNTLCLPVCDPSMGISCRNGYSCCAMQAAVNGPGACGPTGSNFCGN